MKPALQRLQPFGYGALAGLGGLGWEEALALVWGQNALTGSQLGWFALIYAGMGAVILGVLSFWVRSTVGLIWGFWTVWLTVLCTTKVMVWKWSLGIALSMGVGTGVIAGFGLLVCDHLLSSRASPYVWPMRLMAYLGVSTLFFLNLNVYGSAVSWEALWADGCVVFGCVFMAWVLGRGPMGRWTALDPSVGLQAVFGIWLFFGLPWFFFEDQAQSEVSSESGAPVVLVVVDTLRADHLQPYGYHAPTSPNLLKFANQALLFEQAQSTAPWTLPSFGSILTGRLPAAHGAGVNRGASNRQSALVDEVLTLPEAFGRAGWGTHAEVSNIYLRKSYGLHRGFQGYVDDMAMGHYPNMKQLLDVLLGGEWMGLPYRAAPTMLNAALGALEAHRGGRLFLMVHFMDPHAPYDPSEADWNAFTSSYEDQDEWAYDAEIRGVDRAIGQLLAALPEDAIVVVTSDHGERFGEHEGAYSDWHPPKARHGMSQYQELLHVPLLIQAPGLAPGRVKRPVSLVDIATNVSALAKVPWEGPGELWPEVTGADPTRFVENASVSESILYGRERKAVRMGAWKGIWGPDRTELYRLDEDPEETTDLSQRYPDILGGLQVFLPKDVAAETRPVDSSALERENLRRLGYVDDE